MCILVCFYVELLRLPLTRAAHLRAAPVVAASRTENLRLALSPASKACVWTPRHRPLVLDADPPTSRQRGHCCRVCAASTRPVSQSRLPQRAQIAALITLFRDRQKKAALRKL